MKKRVEIITKYFLSLLTCFVIVSIFFALYGLFQISILDKNYASYFGYSLFEVESGSMSPTINVKDMVIVKKTNQIKKDDIITYELDGNFITHRVVEVEENKVVAKGDYNNYEDKTIPKKSIIGKVTLTIPKFGVWKEIVLSPIVLITVLFTMLLFGLGFSYEDKKRRSRKKDSFTFKNEIFENEKAENTLFKKIKAYFMKVKRIIFRKKIVSKSNETVSDNKLDKVLQSESDKVKKEDVFSTKSVVSERQKISISGQCEWIDDDNRDGIRPDSVTIRLMNGDKILESKNITLEDNWKYTFDNLYKYDLDHENQKDYEIKYSIDGDMISGYRKELSEYNIKHTHNPKKINITGQKIWEDGNENNVRPNNIMVKLIKDNVVIETKQVSNKSKWKYTFIDLYKYEKGKEIKYTIDEEKVNGYTKRVTGYDIINTYDLSYKKEK